MAVSNGQIANQDTFNTAFVSKTADSTVVSKTSYERPGSGLNIDDIQQFVNDIAEVVDIEENQKTASMVYATNFAISNGQSRKQALEALDVKFEGAGGHVHDGSDGNGGQISGMSLIDVNLFEAKRQVAVLAGSSGGTTNDVVTSLFSGKTPGGDAATAGVVTSAPYNFCHIRGVDGMPFLSGTGAIVFGRLVESGGNWTIDYLYLDASGNEIGHTFAAYADDISIYYNEVFTFETKPTFIEESLVNGGGGGGGAAAVEMTVTAGEDLDKGEIVEVSTSGVAFKYVPSVSPSIGRQLAIVKDNILDTQDGTVLYGGVYDAGSAVFTKGREYYCSSTSTLVLKTDSSILTGVPLYRMGIALDTQKLAIDFKIEQSHDFPEQKDFNLFSYGQASELIFDNIQVSRYKDAASAVPVDGTGGSPTIANSVTIENSDKFYGSQAYRLRKGSGDGQGEGWAFDFPVPPVARTKVHTIQFDYIVNSGTFNTEDVHVYFYDVTNSALIQPSAFKLLSISTTLTGKVSAEFQVPAGCALGRVILHIASTNASVWVLNVDNIKIVPNKENTGAVVTDPLSYIPSNTQGFGTISAVNLRHHFIGGNLVIQGGFTSGTMTGSTAQIGLPPGMVVGGTTGAKIQVGTLTRAGAAGPYAILGVQGNTYLTFGSGATSQGDVPGTSLLNNNEAVLFTSVSIPIAGRSSNLVLSQNTSTRVVAMKAYLNTNTAVTASNPIKFNTVLNDTHATYSTATGLYTAVVPGFYEVSAALGATTATNAGIYVQPSVGAVTYICQITAANFIYSGSTIVYLKAGETVGIYSDQTTTFRGGASLLSSVSLKLISGPEQIAASESVNCKYNTSAGQSVTTSTIVNFNNKIFDSHNAVTTGAGWRFTAPISGIYEVGAIVHFAGNTFSLGTSMNLELFKNSVFSDFISLFISQVGSSIGPSMNGSTLVSLNQGDFVDVRVSTNNGARNLSTTGSLNQIMIKRIGN